MLIVNICNFFKSKKYIKNIQINNFTISFHQHRLKFRRKKTLKKNDKQINQIKILSNCIFERHK